MNRLISFVGGAALSVAALLASGPDAQAQHHGGTSGGAHYGGGYGGGYRGGYGGGYGNGYRGGYGYGRYGYGYPGFGLYLGLGGLGYGGYGYGYPGYYDNGYAPSYGYGSGYAVQPDYGPNYAGGVQTQSAYPPTGASTEVVIHVPVDAQVWIDNYPTNQSGPVRQLTTPPVLQPGQVYHYTVKAQWNDNGKPVTQEKTVNVEAGKPSVVDFSQAAAPQPTTPPAPPVAPAPTTPPVNRPAKG